MKRESKIKFYKGLEAFKKLIRGRYRSGQTGQTVNLLAIAFLGSNPSLPTTTKLNGFFEANSWAARRAAH